MRNLSPCMSSMELISFLNQPPIWTPVLPPRMVLMPNSAPSSSQSSWPPSHRIQDSNSGTIIPNGTDAKYASPGCLPFQ